MPEDYSRNIDCMPCTERNMIAWVRRGQPLLAVCLFALALVFCWGYWPAFAELNRRWETEPPYSHGYVIPLLALWLLWRRRERLHVAGSKATAWGIPLLLLGTAMRLAGDYYALAITERWSLIPILMGMCLVLLGWQGLRWAWPAIAYLLFMLPLPGRTLDLLANPLQRIATVASTNVLQTLGFPAQAEGNIIVLPNVELGVIEACNGTRMLMSFCAITTLVAIVIPRSVLQRILVALSAIPLALICNIVRIVLTAVLYEMVGDEAGELLVHDGAGLFMCLLAAVLLWLELLLFSRLFVPVPRSPSPALVLGQVSGRRAVQLPTGSRLGQMARLVGLGRR
jgi:exosortase